MSQILLVTVRLHDGRFHGTGEREPSPARLFQALVAGAARGGIPSRYREAFEWLEGLAPPLLATPDTRMGQEVGVYVPNNDLDARGGDPAKIADVRVLKTVQPRLFDVSVPFLFAWEFDAAGAAQAEVICELAERLYQFGRGVDLAWAVGEILDAAALETRLAAYRGRVLRPSGPGDDRGLRCPQRGTFESLEVRFAATRARLRTNTVDPSRQLLVQPPKPRFAQIAYGSASAWAVFELRRVGDEGTSFAWSLDQSHGLVVAARDGAVHRLREALPDRHSEIEAVLIGRRPDGFGAGPASARVRILPLPSIGHEHADNRIRRLLVEVPEQCPLPVEDVLWAFSGLEFKECIMARTWTDQMLRHYRPVPKDGVQVWRTVTPVVLSATAARRRIDPSRQKDEAKGGSERLSEELQAEEGVRQALRHAEVRARVESIRLQREPFGRRGNRVEAFAPGTRFAKERLWHVEIAFSSKVEGPLAIGDGRFLGLGLLAPVREELGLHVLRIEEGLADSVDPEGLARALRRAVMARVQEELGRRELLPTYFSGHEDGGDPATQPHLCYLFDPVGRRLMVLASHRMERRRASYEESRNLALLAKALDGFAELRAGKAGRLGLRPVSIDQDTDPLFAPSRIWQTVTPYQVTRHQKRVGAHEALVANLRSECQRLGLPVPRITAREPRGIKGLGLVGNAELTFEVAVPGPIALGRSHHLGGGVFAGRPRSGAID